MRVLWFSNSPSLAAKHFNFTLKGGGWITSLQKIIVKSKKYSLGVCFFYNGTQFKKITIDGVVYYGMPANEKNIVRELFVRHFAVLSDNAKHQYIDNVLDDFKPDVIQVFGTENAYGQLLKGKFDKVVFHLQGLVEPYSKVYFSLKFNNLYNVSAAGLKTIKGDTFLHQYNIFKKKATREVDTIKCWKYFTGRTDWDKNYVALLNPASAYFHCEELLREEFFNAHWAPPSIDGTVTIGTTIFPNLYKGLDVIYKVINLLKNQPLKVKWKIFGVTENSYLNKYVLKVLGAPFKNKDVVFYGEVPGADLVEELKSCHFFVHPSYIDNSPNSVCEAMLLGMPVLSSSVGGVKTLITHNENGFLFNPYDKYDLAGLILSLASNYETAVNAGIKAKTTAQERHNAGKILKTIENIYEKISAG